MKALVVLCGERVLPFFIGGLQTDTRNHINLIFLKDADDVCDCLMVLRGRSESSFLIAVVLGYNNLSGRIYKDLLKNSSLISGFKVIAAIVFPHYYLGRSSRVAFERLTENSKGERDFMINLSEELKHHVMTIF